MKDKVISIINLEYIVDKLYEYNYLLYINIRKIK